MRHHVVVVVILLLVSVLMSAALMTATSISIHPSSSLSASTSSLLASTSAAVVSASVLTPCHRHALVFDCHNHVHLSIPEGIPTLPPNELLLSSSVNSLPPPHQSENRRMEQHQLQQQQEPLEIPNNVDTTNVNVMNRNDGIFKHAIQIYNSVITNPHSPPHKPKLGGMAIMSTQPRDFPIVDQLSSHLDAKFRDEIISPPPTDTPPVVIIRCYGVHPWFLHEADAEFEQQLATITTSSIPPVPLNPDATHEEDPTTTTTSSQPPPFHWLPYLRHKLSSSTNNNNNTTCCVGEIGLDGHHYDPLTKALHTPMDRQVRAFEAQMHMAADLDKCVSIHAVKAWGPLMDSIRRIRVQRKGKRDLWRRDRKQQRVMVSSYRDGTNDGDGDGGGGSGGETKAGVDEDELIRNYEHLTTTSSKEPLLLPPRIYFHAFGGKMEMVKQLDALCCGNRATRTTVESATTTTLFYGFAPCVNFRSPKTADLIRSIGIDRLVLESDREDHREVMGDLYANVDFVAEALGVEKEIVLETTYANAARLYGF